MAASSGGVVVFASKIPWRGGVCLQVVNRHVMAAVGSWWVFWWGWWVGLVCCVVLWVCFCCKCVTLLCGVLGWGGGVLVGCLLGWWVGVLDCGVVGVLLCYVVWRIVLCGVLVCAVVGVVCCVVCGGGGLVWCVVWCFGRCCVGCGGLVYWVVCWIVVLRWCVVWFWWVVCWVLRCCVEHCCGVVGVSVLCGVVGCWGVLLCGLLVWCVGVWRVGVLVWVMLCCCVVCWCFGVLLCCCVLCWSSVVCVDVLRVGVWCVGVCVVVYLCAVCWCGVLVYCCVCVQCGGVACWCVACWCMVCVVVCWCVVWCVLRCLGAMCVGVVCCCVVWCCVAVLVWFGVVRCVCGVVLRLGVVVWSIVLCVFWWSGVCGVWCSFFRRAAWWNDMLWKVLRMRVVGKCCKKKTSMLFVKKSCADVLWWHKLTSCCVEFLSRSVLQRKWGVVKKCWKDVMKTCWPDVFFKRVEKNRVVKKPWKGCVDKTCCEDVLDGRVAKYVLQAEKMCADCCKNLWLEIRAGKSCCKDAWHSQWHRRVPKTLLAFGFVASISFFE